MRCGIHSSCFAFYFSADLFSFLDTLEECELRLFKRIGYGATDYVLGRGVFGMKLMPDELIHHEFVNESSLYVKITAIELVLV